MGAFAMTKLGARQRTQLPDSAFAYVDPNGRRRLPIHDGAHVRNALARFNQVVFPSEAERDRARTRLLKAAKKHGIVPIGFITGQLRAQAPQQLPTGQLTLLMTDVVESTALLSTLGDEYATLLADLRRLQRSAVRRFGGQEVDARADEYFAVFRHPADAIAAAGEIQRRVRERAWPHGAPRLRAGLHTGRPTPSEQGYVGLAVHAVSRICAVATGGQVVLSERVVAALGDAPPSGVRLVGIGEHALRGFARPELLFELIG
jgi:class 3 adenylate cyclase